MIKRVIFDIDNTLIPWENEYNEEIKKALEDLNINYTELDYEQINKALAEYENVYYTFDKKTMLNYINKYTNKQYPIEFIYNILKRWSKCIPDKIDKNIIETLKYLQKKYEMVILTDWFAEEQINRLECLGIKKYFTQVYSAEKTKRKPFKEAFTNAIGNNKPEECVMIGDNLERDIKGAINAGLKAIHFNPNNKENNTNTEYITISRLEQLIKIL